MQAANIAGNTKKYDIPLSHLDFDYIKKCSDVKELEKILRVLRTREEGFYPQLEECCEERINSLNPNSRVLRKDKPIYTMKDLEKKEREELEKELENWPSDVQSVDGTAASQQKDIVEEDNSDLPPIRSGTITLTAQGTKTVKPETKEKKRVMPRDYREWDKVDVDKELEKVEDGDKKGKERTLVANKDVHDLPDHIDSKGMSEGEKLMKANREKDKGNEAFRSNDCKEAIIYYSRSISLLPTAASYNNRALAYLKESEWEKAIGDTNTVLEMEPDNIKALLRRGSAYRGLQQLDKARRDIDRVLEIEPQNKQAQELLKQIEKDKQEKKEKGRRMVIEDVEGTEENEEHGNKDNSKVTSDNEDEAKGSNSVGENIAKNSGDSSEKKTSRRMKIEEVDSDSDKEIEEITIGAKLSVDKEDERTNVVVNGHVTTDKLSKNIEEAENESINDHVMNKQIWVENEVAETKENEETCDIAEVADKGTAENIPINNITEYGKSDQAEQVLTGGDNVVQETVVEEKAEVENVEERPVETVDINAEEEGGESGSSSETEFVDAPEDLRRPVFYMTELPQKAVKMKEDATTLFKNGQYGEACEKYSKVIDFLEREEDQIVNLSLMYSNRAACRLKTGDLSGAVKDCNSSLQLVPHSVKPLLRRAMAYEHLERYSLAYIDYCHVLLLDSRVEQAHFGTKRCQHMLSEKDGPLWREKVHPPKVSPWQIPDIIGLDGKSTNPVFTNHPPAASQSKFVPATNSQSQPSITTPSPAQKEITREKEVPKQREPELSPQQKFDVIKAEGNDFVNKNKFREALECYNQCEEVLPGQTVIYTNRALCYIRTNQPEKAEEDCTRALNQEKDNVKALYRRAQARKMLKRYRDGVEDLKHLLSVDPKNVPAQKEIEVLKDYWREELKSTQKTPGDLKEKKTDISAQVKEKAADNKQRKRMVIQEVDSEDEEKDSEVSSTKAKDTKSKVPDVKSGSSAKSNTKPVLLSKSCKPEQIQTGSSKKETKASKKKSTIKETSQGLPSVPKSARKLDKATPYEFISAWNALKKSETVKPYYDLLKQVKPNDIKTVISNELDGAMLSVIMKCVADHYLPNGEGDASYEILRNLSTLPRFGTIAMFMSQAEKEEMSSVLNKLQSLPSTLYTTGEIQKLRKDYRV